MGNPAILGLSSSGTPPTVGDSIADGPMQGCAAGTGLAACNHLWESDL